MPSRIDALCDLPLHKHLGIKLREASRGQSVLELVVNRDNANLLGVLHGGVIYTICDVAGFAALASVMPEDEMAVTHDIHVSCMRPALLGSTLRVEAKLVQKGRTLAFMDAVAKVGDKVIATARVTKSIVPNKPAVPLAIPSLTSARPDTR